jgi:23S rRNA (uracil1939-C5)-methyltransferase
VQLTIEKLVYGGEGLGRLPDGRVVFVTRALPVERVRVRLLPSQGRGPLRAKLVSIEEPAVGRLTPGCSVFGRCGGCQWQHADIPTQQHWKRHIIEESLQRLGQLSGIPVLPVLPQWQPGQPLGRRNHVQWAWQAQPRRVLGYRLEKSRDITPFDHCLIVPDAWSALARDLEVTLPATLPVARVVLRANEDASQWLLGLECDPVVAGRLEISEEHRRWAAALAQRFPALRGVVVLAGQPSQDTTPLWGDTYLSMHLSQRVFRVSAPSFFQTQTQVADALQQYLVHKLSQILGPKPVDTALDVYSGVGFFTLHLNALARHWYALEGAPSAVADFHHNLQQNAVSNVTLYAGEITSQLRRLPTSVDAAIVDPPRNGCSPSVLAWLQAHVRQCIAYVSCNPTTLARDLRQLTNAGWRVLEVQPFDMFPHTYHVESATLLMRDASLA